MLEAGTRRVARALASRASRASSRLRPVGERRDQLRPGADAELAVDLPQVELDRLGRQEQVGRDVAVGRASRTAAATRSSCDVSAVPGSRWRRAPAARSSASAWPAQASAPSCSKPSRAARRCSRASARRRARCRPPKARRVRARSNGIGRRPSSASARAKDGSKSSSTRPRQRAAAAPADRAGGRGRLALQAGEHAAASPARPCRRTPRRGPAPRERSSAPPSPCP